MMFENRALYGDNSLLADKVRVKSSLGSSSTPHAPRVKRPIFTQPTPHTDDPPSPHTALLVQPFRRTKCRCPPPGVPLLDLTRFNELDSQMEPVRVNVSLPTDRSRLSWGSVPVDQEQLTSDLCEKEDVIETSEDEVIPPHTSHTPSHPALLNNSQLEPSQSKFIEDKLLSNERGNPPNASVYPCHPVTTVARHTLINKKLRFEARVLTQRGRDVHRELCGFYFIADGSITVYEFRKFGRKSSALPLIGRGVYKHLYGPQQDECYDINTIKQGRTLCFATSSHPGLPMSLTSYPVLALRVTYVDEAAKRQLLIEGCNPVEVGHIDQYLASSESTVQQSVQHRTLQEMVVSRLKGRASKTLVGLGRDLRALGINVTKQQLEQSLRNYHISLTVEDINQLWMYIADQQNNLISNHGGSFHGNVSVDGLISHLVVPLTEQRHALVRKVFRKLDNLKTGSLTVEVLRRFFNGGQKSMEGVWPGLYECLQPIGRTEVISYADFEHYYHGVSLETGSDEQFITLIKTCWTL